MNKENIRLTKKPSFHESKFKTTNEEVEIIGEIFLEVNIKQVNTFKSFP